MKKHLPSLSLAITSAVTLSNCVPLGTTGPFFSQQTGLTNSAQQDLNTGSTAAPLLGQNSARPPQSTFLGRPVQKTPQYLPEINSEELTDY